jgi:hypothetical protein
MFWPCSGYFWFRVDWLLVLCSGIVVDLWRTKRLCQLFCTCAVVTQAAGEFLQHFHAIVVTALHEATEPVAAEGMRDVVVLHCMTASTRPCVAAGGERADCHAKSGGVLEGLVFQAEEGV